MLLLVTGAIAGGCKPAPKTSRANEQEPSPEVAENRLSSIGGETASPTVLAVAQPAGEPVSRAGGDANVPAAGNATLHASATEPSVDPNTGDVNQPNVLEAKPGDIGEPNELADSFNSKFTQILNIYVNSEGRVDYARLRRMRLLFAPLLQELDKLGPGEYDLWPEAEKIAFWINTYNVGTLKVVADNYPIKASVYKMLLYPANSIMQIDRAWSDYRLNVMGVAYNLSEIEQRILLNQFREPRIAFALSFASQWSPRLLNRPYYGATLDRQLDEQTREFIASDKGFRIDKNSATVYLSIVFKEARFHPGFVERYGSDRRFDDDKAENRAMLNFISTYLDRADVDYLTGKKYTVASIRPDWSLNE